MKFISFYILTFLLITNCQDNNKTEAQNTETKAVEKTFPEKLADATIYEVNIRQYTPEGTFKAFEDHLPRLQKLGVKVLWLMPIHPISEKNRKGSLGSYYAPQDYTDVNAEFGTLDDFKHLLQKAHDMGFYVILDWVPNHTGRDHKWIKEHPEFYIHDENGDITYEAMSPTDVWWDTALLDHKNPETRQAMIQAMRFWVDLDIDGFRLDHGCGDKIPLYLWEEARATLDPLRDLFWLAECGHETFILDGSYADELEVEMRAVASGEAPADVLLEWIDKDMFKNGRTAYRMTYTSNHDLNSWNGTVFERFGAKNKAFAAFVFTAYGFPLILGGQEAGMEKRLKFFEKDTMNWTDPKGMEPFYQSLVKLRKDNPALWAGDTGGFPTTIENNENVVGFIRKIEGNKVIGLFNFSGEDQSVIMTNKDAYGTYSDYFTGMTFSINEKPFELKADQYLVFRD